MYRWLVEYWLKMCCNETLTVNRHFCWILTDTLLTWISTDRMSTDRLSQSSVTLLSVYVHMHIPGENIKMLRVFCTKRIVECTDGELQPFINYNTEKKEFFRVRKKCQHCRSCKLQCLVNTLLNCDSDRLKDTPLWAEEPLVWAEIALLLYSPGLLRQTHTLLKSWLVESSPGTIAWWDNTHCPQDSQIRIISHSNESLLHIAKLQAALFDW